MNKTSVRTTGFGSPAEAYRENGLDWTSILFPKPHAMYVFSARGSGFEEEGIHDGDLLIIDSSRRPSAGTIVVAVIEGELCLGRLEKSSSGMTIHTGSEQFDLGGSEEMVFGTVARLLRMFP